jgi:outer membrane protein assembly factor BamB
MQWPHWRSWGWNVVGPWGAGRRLWRSLMVMTLLLVAVAVGRAGSESAAGSSAPVSVVPARLLETRVGPTERTVDRLFEGIGRRAAGSVVELVVAGRGGVAKSADAVLLNVTAVSPARAGFLTVWPCGAPKPLASNVNFVAGAVVPNAVLAKVGAGGKVCIFSSAETDIVADVNGYVPSGGSPSSVVPARLLETRVGPTERTVDRLFEGIGRRAAGSVVELVVAGRGGVAKSADAVLLNVTAVSPARAGFLTVWPCGAPKPLASNVNFVAGAVVANAVLAKVGAGGKVCIFSSAETDIVADVNGYVPSGGSPSSVVPARLLETRVGPTERTVDRLFEGIGRRAAGSVVELVVAGRGGVAKSADAVLLNVTAVSPARAGFLTVWPCGAPKPLASNVNFVAGAVVANAVLAKVGAGGKVCIFSSAETDIVADVNGYVARTGTTTPSPTTTSSVPAGTSTSTSTTVPGGTTSSTSTTTTSSSSTTSTTTSSSTTTVPLGPKILTTGLPGAAVGVPYAYALAAVGGTGTYTWSIIAGALPNGLVLRTATGLIEGTPTAVGSSPVTVRAQDATGQDSSALVLTVSAAANWPHPGADPAGSRSVPGEMTLTPPAVNEVGVEWSMTDSVSSVAIADGVAYIGGAIPGTSLSGVIARDLGTGEELWSEPVYFMAGVSDPCVQIAVTTSKVLCLTRSVHALQRGGDHQEIWDSDDGDPGANPTHMLVAGGYVITFGPVDGTTSAITAFRESDGEFLWKRTVTGAIGSQAIIDGRIVVIVNGPTDTRLRSFALNDTGSVGWNLVIQTESSGLVGAGTLVAVRQGSTIEFRSPDTGAVIRSWTSPRTLYGPLASDAARLYVSTAEFDDLGFVYDAGVTAVRISDATQRWHVDTRDPIRSGLAIGGGIVWVHASDLGFKRIPSELLAVDAATGAVLREFAPDDTSFAPPTLGNGRLLVATAFRVDVMGVMAPTVSVPLRPLPTGWVGTGYTGALTAVGGTPPMTWSIGSGALPPGLSLSPGGSLSGVPTTPGTYDFGATVTDSRGRSATRTLTIGVRTAAAGDWTTGRHSASRNPFASASMITADSLSTFSIRWRSAPYGEYYLAPGYFAEEPVITGTWLFGVGNDRSLLAFDVSTNGLNKAPSWTIPRPVDDAFLGTPTVVGSPTTGMLYVLGSHHLYAIDLATRTIDWSYEFGSSSEVADAPTVVGSRIVVQRGAVTTAIAATTGALDWSVTGTGQGYGLTTDGTRVYGYEGCQIVARNPTTGAEIWRRAIPPPEGQCGPPIVPAFHQASPAVVDGVVYATAVYDAVVALDAATGNLLWRNYLLGQGAPAVTERWMVTFAPWENAIHVQDRRSGRAVMKIAGVQGASHPAVVGDLIMIMTTDSRIRAYDLITGEQLWSSAALGASSGTSPVIVGRNRVWAYTSDGSVVGLGGP